MMEIAFMIFFIGGDIGKWPVGPQPDDCKEKERR
jgi:hypothetical protein